MRGYLKPALVGLIGAIVGGLIFEAALHVWSDHRDFHALDAFVKAHAAAIAGLK